jgi:glutamyl-Q tRNA(Asp) synthetase
LHFGSLIAALASLLNARHQGGFWQVRIEDLDPPREQPGAADDILRTLEALALEWDGEVLRQSRRGAWYEDALERLAAAGLTYRCICSRQDIRLAGKPGVDGPRYPGTCRERRHDSGDASIRLRTDDVPLTVVDRLQGAMTWRLASGCGDFILKRRDGLYAYQLAVVVDDAAQGITEVVRGSDLLDSTPRQLLLIQRLGLPVPVYVHLPLAVDARGAKLSKQYAAVPVSQRDPAVALCAALVFLGQSPPAELRDASPAEIVGWAIRHWSLETVPKMTSIAVD